MSVTPIIIQYDTSILIGKTLDQCYTLLDAFNDALVHSAQKLLNGFDDNKNIARRMLQRAEINPDNQELLKHIIQNKNLRVSMRVSIKYFTRADTLLEDFLSFLTPNHDQNRINVQTKVDPEDNVEKVEKILARG